MTREQFIAQLKNELAHLPEEERNDILRDQEEYIRDAVQAGRTEEQAVASLGTPKAFAASLSVETKIQQIESSEKLKQQIGRTFSAVFAILALAPLNIIFVLGPFLTLVSINIAGWGVAAAILLASVVGLGVWAVKLVFISAGAFAHLSSLFFILGCICAGAILLWLMAEVTRLFVRATLSYLKWNLDFIQSKT